VRGLELPEVEPWPDRVDGAEVLNNITAAIREHLVVSAHAAEAMALWVVHAHAHDAALISARLAFTSPTKRCGKTTALQVVQALVPRALPAANITAAALFRAVEAVKPTLLIDEADTFLKNSDELRGILNSGHNRATAYVICTTGEDHTPTQFRTWAPVAVAMIGELPGTLSDRSVIIEMQRKKSGDTVRRFRSDRTEAFAVLARKAARFAEDTFEALREWDGYVPDKLHDRAADNWRPLLAIADAAGGDWRTRARAAALALSGVEEDDGDEAGAQLLADMRDIFARFGPKVATMTVLAQLNQMETRPWPEFKHGKPMTDLQLASLLKPFKVKPKKVRDGEHTFRGYEEEAFRDAFARYVPA
jgi:putative DNA primase/helicase